MNKAPVIWLTGMSGSGKSTLANYIKDNLKTKGYKVIIIDGDSIRDLDKKKLDFGVNDVLKNNTRIAFLSEKKRKEYDFVLVPVISPYDKIRQQVRKILEPNFHLIYLKVDIKTLKYRDPKGLYAAADRGEINDLIGYSDVNPYEEPINPELTVTMLNNQTIKDSYNIIFEYLDNIIFI
jgi:adenylyl-sulfate kinase